MVELAVLMPFLRILLFWLKDNGFCGMMKLQSEANKMPQQKVAAEKAYFSIKGMTFVKSPSIIAQELLSFSVIGGEISWWIYRL